MNICLVDPTRYDFVVKDDVLRKDFVRSVLEGTEYPKDNPVSWFDDKLPSKGMYILRWCIV
jgi:hypothetical protein